jgi:hypothetical protein
VTRVPERVGSPGWSPCRNEPELAHASGSDYMVGHWLAAYAVLYLT